ncbi:calcium-translocating P-type ATPase, PMCA-type [Porphyromonadaceae bacterium W3.11]|nr:calcium-translocating P-type ATPase, PMCA-type [Porphyromonadaceae bacterium W3.11]
MTENIYHAQTKDEVANDFQTSLTSGLSSSEATKRLEKYGENKLNKKANTPLWKIFLHQFNDALVYVLIIAAILTAVVSFMEGTNSFTDSIIIMAILIVNAVIGTVQEYRAMVSLDALNKMSAPHSKVLRDGSVVEISSEHVVPGDIVILDVGDIVPADIRLSESFNLQIQESALTGESVPAEKNAEVIDAGQDLPLGDRHNIAFSTGLVSYGRGTGIVVGTGMNTEVGKIAGMLSDAADQVTPMQKRLNQLGKVLGYGALAICALIFGLGVLYGNDLVDMFMMAVSLGVAAIPEGLQVVSTLVLAMGVQRLVKQNAIVRTLPSVETLGSASVICSDKTGTLTQNRMTIVEMWSIEGSINAEDYEIGSSKVIDQMLLSGTLANDAHLSENMESENRLSGDPTETAIVDLAEKNGINKNDIEKKYQRIGEVPFDSERKLMSSINKTEEGGSELQTHVKGGTDELLEVCTHYLKDGELIPLTEDIKEQIRSANVAMAEKALRVLAFAYANISAMPKEQTSEMVERDLIFLGLMGMIDPPRPEAIKAVSECRTAGIKPVMITGDHQITATAIAREIGIAQEGDLVLNGTQLENMDDNELFEVVPKCSVYARVAPEHKVRIVKAWQKHGDVVAMTGDGVNDAPALKTASIGVAMGITGTEVSKGAADLILTDDNFATIVLAVREGRRIYDNIVKAIQYLLSTNIGEVILILIATVFNLGTPLLPIQLLWINLVTDSLPALGISLDPEDKDVMNRPPIDSNKGFFTKGFIWRISYQGVMVGLIGLTSYLIGMHDGGQELGQTMAFISICMAQLLHIRNLHSNVRPSWHFSPLRNKKLIGAMLISLMLILVVYFIPFLRDIFHLVELDTTHWVIVMVMMFIPILLVNIFKLLKINTIKGE